jgi:uncharacterized membrane protein YkvA (DUF1232 family)
LVIGAFAYVYSPLDIIPDGIPLIGWVDDVKVLQWTLHELKKEIQEFKVWAAEQPDLDNGQLAQIQFRCIDQ